MKRQALPGSFWAGTGLAFLILLLTVVGAFEGLSRSFLDWSLRHQANRIQPPEDAVLVVIDEPSLEFLSRTYNQRWPWSRDVFAGLFLALHQAGAKQIVVDLMFLENSSHAELDDLLGAYAAAVDGLILAAPLGKVPVFWSEEFRQAHPEFPLENRIGHVNYQADPDGVIRRYRWSGSLASRAADASDVGSDQALLRWYGGLRDLPPRQVLSAQTLVQVGYGPQGLLSQVKALKVDEYDPKALRSAFANLPQVAGGSLQGKTVFLGTNAAGTFDVKALPVSRLEPGILIHFTSWCNARQHLFIPEIGHGTLWTLSTALAFLLAFGFTGWGWNRPQVRLLACLTALGSILLAAGSYWLLPFLWLTPVAPTASLLSGFLLLTTRHWVEETRRKREVQALFGSYVSPTVVRQLVENPDSLKLTGEKKELSVYFSDLAGFTDMSETLAPEQLVALMNEYLNEMSEFILEDSGYLDKYIGDAIMGVFGAPEPLDNHALSACRAALKSRDHLVKLNQRLGLEHGQELYARIGINTGEMIVGNIGSARKRNFTVVGDAVNLASRLEGANKEFGTTILLGARTEELARDFIVTRPVELLRVKGKKQPVQTHELLALKSSATALDLERVSIFQEAYQYYQQRSFTEALLHFEKAASLVKTDALSALYIERCREFLQHPPPQDWDGVFVMKRK